MGVNTIVIVVKPLAEKNLSANEILKEFCVGAEIDQENLDFESVLQRLSNSSSFGYVAASIYNEKTIFVDDAHHVDANAIAPFTTTNRAEVLRVESSDNVGAGEFSFWIGGELVRKATFGMEEWLDELKEMGITEKEILASCEPVDIGEPLEIENKSNLPMDVLANYALDYIDFYKLRWSLYRVTS